ncbi:MAG TPA: hypothetical protein VLH08_20120, partial [Acidobacteriota bacterium]|nr:hypothetical protein [Acidobacteriota bacterium]
EFRDPAFDQQFFVLNKDQQGEVDTLQLEENNNSVVLKHVAGCRPEIISQMQEQLQTKTTLS